jgi:hypothetical protein
MHLEMGGVEQTSLSDILWEQNVERLPRFINIPDVADRFVVISERTDKVEYAYFPKLKLAKEYAMKAGKELKAIKGLYSQGAIVLDFTAMKVKLIGSELGIGYDEYENKNNTWYDWY